MSRPWRLCESLKQLRVQVNALWPHRDKSSDGSIGDASHASRSSDHNPWVVDHHGQGVVTAIDIDADLAPGVNVAVLRDALLASKDPRIKYIIHDRKIYASYPAGGVGAWKPRPYHGANAHQHHMHISVNSSPMYYDSTAPWTIAVDSGDDFELEIPQIQKVKESAAAASAGQAPVPTELRPAEPPASVPSSDDQAPPATQVAENITNVNAGDKNVPDNFVPEDKTVDAPPKEDSTKKAATMTVMGFTVPAFLVGFIHAVQSAITNGFISASDIGSAVLGFIQNNTKYVFAGLGLVIVGMYLKKFYKQCTLWLSMYFAAKPDMHNVTVKPQ